MYHYIGQKKSQKVPENIENINIAIIGQKNLVSLYNFGTYFFTLGEVNKSFSDVLKVS